MNNRYGNDYDEEYGSISFRGDGDRDRDRDRDRGGENAPGRWRSQQQGRAGSRSSQGQSRDRGYEREDLGWSRSMERTPQQSYGPSQYGYGPSGGYGPSNRAGSYGGSGSYGSSGSYGAGYGGYGDTTSSERRSGGFYGKGPKGYQRSDERIREDVSDRLTDDDDIDASDITVTVKDGEITLEGSVTDRRAKHRAEDVAEAVTGVKDVHNRLKTRKGLLQEMGDRLTGKDETEQHGHAGAGPRNVQHR